MKNILLSLSALTMMVSCGAQEELSSDTKIIGGWKAEPSEKNPGFFSTVSLSVPEDEDDLRSDPKSFCSGTLIHRNIVLTAAHCLQNADGSRTVPYKRIQVHFGSKVGEDTLAVKPIKFVVHPDFNFNLAVDDGPSRAPDDIALIMIGGRTPSGFYPTPIAESPSLLRTSDKVLNSGYGVNLNAIFGKTGRLRSVWVNVDDIIPSEKRFSTANLFKGVTLGDSGGPSYIYKNGKWQVVGVTSVGANILGTSLGFNFFTYVPYYTSWIKSTASREFGINL